MSPPIVAIETNYLGYRFRSRLEARWAVFFTELELSWDYEVEGYDLGALGLYLPDFRVTTPGYMCIDSRFQPGRKCWVEIKAEEPTPNEIDKLQALCVGTGIDGHLICGDPLRAAIVSVNVRPRAAGGLIGVLHYSAGLDALSAVFDSKFTATTRAATLARQARFEHGQNGSSGDWTHHG